MTDTVEQQYRSIFENAIEGIYQTTDDGHYVRVNPALARIYGYDSPEQLIDGLTDIASQLYVDPTRRDDFKRIMASDGLVEDFEAQVYRRDGRVIWIAENARVVRDASGVIKYYEGMVEDITRRKQNEQQIRLLATVFDSVADGILIVDDQSIIRAVNPSFGTMTGFNPAELIGEPLDILEPGFQETGFLPSIWREMRETGQWSGEATCRRHQDRPFVAALSLSAVRDGAGRFAHAVVTCSNISERKEQEQRIWHHANYDLLTRLPNRWLVTERLQQSLLRAQRTKTMTAVLFLDLNGFKQVNDGLGHPAGDELLRQVASRLRSCTRLTDIVGRLGGDEFLVVAPDITERDAGVQVVNKILYNFSEPFRIAGHEIFSLPSIGIAFFPDDGDSADALVRNADLAMYEAKRNKAPRFVAYEAHMQSRSKSRLDLENDLRRALERREFRLYYQPKVDIVTGELTGAEALVRWQHPDRGLVSPAEFITLAEESGLILPLGEWALREACQQLCRWRAAGLPIPGIAVNLSPRQFREPELVQRLSRVLTETGVSPALLQLELTEGAMLGDFETAVTMLTALKTLGVSLAIDDFGTGYSSLAYLKRLPADVVKIDQSFIRDLTGNPVDGKIVEVIVDLAEALGFRVVAEGVETESQVAFLRRTGCHELQGYLIARPMPAAALTSYLNAIRLRVAVP